ncbi:MAG: Mor transcription activator family protein [Clostridiales bacterium]|nr:Mor transcription activator family protein [Clostridiales bacterium]
MDKYKDNGICMVPKPVLQYSQEVIEMSQYNTNLFHKVYREISEELGIEAALTIHHMFKGTQVCFPVRFLDTQCVKEMILKEYDGTNVSALARKYDYSEKTVRRIIKESIKKK